MDTTDQEILDRAYEALGVRLDDKSVEASNARTWVDATFDDDIEWLEKSTPGEIRSAYAIYRKLVHR